MSFNLHASYFDALAGMQTFKFSSSWKQYGQKCWCNDAAFQYSSFHYDKHGVDRSVDERMIFQTQKHQQWIITVPCDGQGICNYLNVSTFIKQQTNEDLVCQIQLPYRNNQPDYTLTHTMETENLCWHFNPLRWRLNLCWPREFTDIGSVGAHQDEALKPNID